MTLRSVFKSAGVVFVTVVLSAGCNIGDDSSAPQTAPSEPSSISAQKPGSQCVSPPPGVISWWPAEENALDIVSGKNGTLENGATFAPGLVGKAFSLDGIDDFVSIPNFDLNRFTFEAWVKRDRINVPGDFDRLCMSVDNGGWGVYYEGFDNTVRLTYTGYSNVSSNATISDFDWHHIAVTFDGSQACFYIDGSLDRCVPYAVEFSSEAGGGYSIGSRGESEFFDGLIDEVRIYDRDLGPAEIQAIFNAGSAGMCRMVTICHKPGTPAQKTLVIPVQALAGHLGHGDRIGPCECSPEQ
jgi:hypothetical protein